jgi:DNA modification methylase
MGRAEAGEGGLIRLLQGDCREVLRTLPDRSVHCIVTSPPYFGLRDYGVPGQIGLEDTPEAYIATMVEVFRECRRVLRDDGTLWLNLGDSYNGSGTIGRNDQGKRISDGEMRDGWKKTENMGSRKASTDCKSKDLLMIPAQVALALRGDGWYLRSEIIWHKPNPMPESVTDRPTSAHEKIYLLSKQPRYFFDADAVREPHISDGRGGFSNKETLKSIVLGAPHAPSLVNAEVNPAGRNLRNVWTIATQSYSGAHFATFPPALIEPCIKAGTSEKGCCAKCGAPWVREVERAFRGDNHTHVYEDRPIVGSKMRLSGKQLARQHAANPNKFLGWAPSCSCFGHFEERDGPPDWISEQTGERKKIRVYVPDTESPPPVPCTVLDPFGGAGTTALVADRLQRNAILIELNESYAAMARERIAKDAGLFAESRDA